MGAIVEQGALGLIGGGCPCFAGGASGAGIPGGAGVLLVLAVGAGLLLAARAGHGLARRRSERRAASWENAP